MSIPTTTRKIHKDTFFLIALFSDKKRGKSQQGGLAPSSFRTTGGVHESVARAMRGECVRYGTKKKWVVLPLSAASAKPRVRTYHTKKPSRFVHALPARPLKKRGARAWMKSVRVCDGEHIFYFIYWLYFGFAW